MRRFTMTLIAGGLIAVAPAAAQNAASIEARVSTLEKRMNTVERVLTRQNGGPLVQPEIGPSDATGSYAGTPASAPLADLEARIAGVERETQGLTNRVETIEHRVAQVESEFAAYRRSTDARLAKLENGGAPAGGPAPLAPDETPTPRPVATPRPRPATPVADPGRADRVAAVPRPTGADAADKGVYAYNYGYRLWKAGLYADAEGQLEKFATRFPRHRLTSRAQHVLGQVYLDDNRPKDAAQVFYDNYSKLPDGDRASDSLIALARALTVMKRPAADVCQVYKEVGEVYGDKLSSTQQAEVTRGRATYKCPR